MDGDYIDKIEKLVIDEQKIALRPLARVDRCFDVIVLASESLKVAVEKSGATGISFRNIEDWPFQFQ